MIRVTRGGKGSAIALDNIQASIDEKKIAKVNEQALIDAELRNRVPITDANNPDVIAAKAADRESSSILEMPTTKLGVIGNPQIVDAEGRVQSQIGASQGLIDEAFSQDQMNVNDVDALNPGYLTKQSRQQVAENLNYDIQDGTINRMSGSLRQLADGTPESELKLDSYFGKANKRAKDNPRDFVKGFIVALDKSNRGPNNLFGAVTNKVLPDTVNKTGFNANQFLMSEANNVNFLLRSTDKLNVSSNPSDPNAPIRGAYPSVFGLAIMTEVMNSFDDQTTENGNPSERRFSNAMDRDQLGKAVSKRAEMMLRPTDLPPGQTFGGEISNLGYKSKLTEQEHDRVGQYLLQEFADSEAFPWFESQIIKSEATGRTKVVFHATRMGDLNLNKIRNGLKDALGLRRHIKPIRTVAFPYVKGTSARTEANYFEKQMTQGLKGVTPVPAMEEAMGLLNNIKHTPDPASLLMGIGIQKSASPTLTKYMKQDAGYQTELAADFLDDFEGRAELEGLKVEQLEIRNSFGVVATTFKEAADIKAEQVVRDHKEEKEELTSDAIVRYGQTVMYDSMAVSGSGRLLYQNDELNPNMHKYIRAIMKAAKPTVFTKTHESNLKDIVPTAVINSAIKKANLRINKEARIKKGMDYTTEEKFMIVMARTLVPKGDKFATKGYGPLLTEFRNRYAELSALSLPLLDYVSRNADLVKPENRQALQDNKDSVEGLPVNAALEQYLIQQGKDEFYFGLNNLVQLARYNGTAKGQEIQTRATAEADGVSNGATIQGFQMGVYDIMARGGIQFKDDKEVEGDLRDFVFDYMKDLPQVQKDNSDWAKWQDVFKQIESEGKRKDLLKLPIMTSIFGLEPRFQTGAAKKFIKANPEFFDAFDNTTEDQKIESLTTFLKEALTHTLGGALEHAKMGKRIGRMFAFANTIPQIRGPELIPGVDNSRFIGKMGGKKSVAMDAEEYMTTSGRSIVITTNKTVDDATAKSDPKKISPGVYTETKAGSKLMNSFPVNTTHMIDSAVMTRAINRFLGNNPGAFMMQMYDGIISDVDNFVEISEIINEEFGKVNLSYDLLKEEKRALENMIKEITLKMEADPEAIIDLSVVGEYALFGKYLDEEAYRKAVVNVDIAGPDVDEQGTEYIRATKQQQVEYKRLKDEKKAIFLATQRTAGNARLYAEEFRNGKRKLKAKDFLKYFNQTMEDLNIIKDQNKLIYKVNERKKGLKPILRTDNYI